MTTEEEFWKAIEASPDDESLRMVFADWLEEQGRAVEAAAMRVVRFEFGTFFKDSWFCRTKEGVYYISCEKKIKDAFEEFVVYNGKKLGRMVDAKRI